MTATTTSASSVVPSLVRTATPYAVAAVLALTARIGLDLPEGSLTDVITAVFTFVFGTAYYTAARLVEQHLTPWGAVLLGSTRTPTYDPPAPLPAAAREQEPVAACAPGEECVDRPTE